MEIRTIAIVGAGALGIVWGEYAQRALGQERVCFIADPVRAARYRREGIYCNGSRCSFRFLDAASGTPADLVIFAVKSTGLVEAMEEAAPFVGPETTILSLLNGVTSEVQLGGRFGMEKLVYCVAQGMDATRTGNQLVYQMPGEVRIGIPLDASPQQQARLAALTAYLDRAAYPYTVEADILHRMWGKLMLNVGVNQVCMVYETDYGGVQQLGPARETLLAAMDEVRRVAEHRGIILTAEDRDSYVTLMDTLTPAGMPSMRQDGLAKRLSEVDIFAGTILDYAEQYGVHTPVNRWLFDRVREMEAAY